MTDACASSGLPPGRIPTGSWMRWRRSRHGTLVRRRGVAGRPTLVVLDAFEHVLPATGVLGDLLMRAPELQALVTSRERLRVAGERELALGPLPPEAAAALFLDRVHDLDSQVPNDAPVVSEICRLVSGLPLPLELAAAHVRYLSLDLLRDRLHAGLTDARHVVEEAVAWSVSSLSNAQRAVLAAAAMFEAGWRLDGLQAVCGEVDVIEALGVLADRSLVQLDTGAPTPRWRMLNVVREIAAGLEPARPARRNSVPQLLPASARRRQRRARPGAELVPGTRRRGAQRPASPDLGGSRW